MKKHFVFLILLLSFRLQTVVFASETDGTANQTIISENVSNDEKVEVSPNETETQAPIPTPIDQKRQNIDGKEYLIKTYSVAVDFNPDLLIEKGFEENGFLYAHHTTNKNENPTEIKKDVADSKNIETSSNSMEEILKRLPSELNYEVDGYIGILHLDTNSINTEVSGYSTKTSTISTIQEYPGLMYADPSYVPQTATKDGHTLSLVDVKWVVMGTGLAGDTLVPTEYKATASYSKNVSRQIANGYVTTADYKGIVSKTEVNNVEYAVTYLGSEIFIPTPEPTPEPIEVENSISNFPWAVVGGIIGFLFLCGGAVFLVTFLKSRKGVQIYNLIDKDLICIGRQVVDPSKPLIDLNEFKDVIQSNSFTFILDKPTCKKLFGRSIAVTLDDLTVMHNVKGYNEEYRFELELGVILDVK